MGELFKPFPKERETFLKNLYRYSAFDLMFYRHNLWDHCQRVSWLVEELEPVVRTYYKKYDAERARITALMHDDAERFTGDIQARVKARASKHAESRMDKDEEKAVEELAAISPRMVGKYRYKDLLMEMVERKTLEPQIVTYADKLDAFCESLHEVLAGNFSHIQTLLYYPRAIAFLDRKYPYLTPILQDRSSEFTDLERFLDKVHVKSKTYAPFRKPFTARNVTVPSTIPFYDAWRKLVLKRGGREGMRMLTKQTEFLPR